MRLIKKSKNAGQMARRGKKGNRSPMIPGAPRNSSITKIQAASFQGPLPPPQILSHYDEIVPGSAERIISLWERQVQHRQELEKKAIGSDIRQSYFGAALGFIIAIAAIGAGTFLAYNGQPTEGLAAIITALVGLVGVYGWGSYQRRKERSQKVNQ